MTMIFLNIFRNKPLARYLFIKRSFSKNTILLKSANAEEDLPIKFTTSQAHTYKARQSIKNDTDIRLWYEPIVLIGSLSAFIVYFTILRADNDLDEEFKVSLYERIAGLEEKQLINFLDHNQKDNEETSSAKVRLQVIKEENKLTEEKN
ncbi:hypothetical protein HHI36_014902 [Cryptolaemus montrouzieri]|uniref:Uncharacterized protein n=1 Tax=Cryptolaemus montrouzieri TaxID=559131 RepID=A0ABD2N4D0_9CUCU